MKRVATESSKLFLHLVWQDADLIINVAQLAVLVVVFVVVV